MLHAHRRCSTTRDMAPDCPSDPEAMASHQRGQEKKRTGVHAMLPCFPRSNNRNRNRLQAQVASPHPPAVCNLARSAGPIFRPLRSVGHLSTSRSDPRCGARDNGGRPRRCLRADAGIVQARPPRAARDRPSFLQMHWKADKEGSGDFRGPGAPVRDAPIATSRCPASRPPATPSQTTYFTGPPIASREGWRKKRGEKGLTEKVI